MLALNVFLTLALEEPKIIGLSYIKGSVRFLKESHEQSVLGRCLKKSPEFISDAAAGQGPDEIRDLSFLR